MVRVADQTGSDRDASCDQMTISSSLVHQGVKRSRQGYCVSTSRPAWCQSKIRSVSRKSLRVPSISVRSNPLRYFQSLPINPTRRVHIVSRHNTIHPCSALCYRGNDGLVVRTECSKSPTHRHMPIRLVQRLKMK